MTDFEIEGCVLEADVEGFVHFGDVSRRLLGIQCQYGSRYVHGRIEGYPNFGEGLRFQNQDTGDYHSYRIHKDDIAEFVRRVREFRPSTRRPAGL